MSKSDERHAEKKAERARRRTKVERITALKVKRDEALAALAAKHAAERSALWNRYHEQITKARAA